MLVQATGAPAFSAACSGGKFGSQWTPRNRRPVTFAAASETSQTSGGVITSGWISVVRSKPASSEIIGVFVTPPGTRALTATPVPSLLAAVPGYGPDVAENRAKAREILAKLGYGPDRRLAIKVAAQHPGLS